jgi:hypothetical protein
MQKILLLPELPCSTPLSSSLIDSYLIDQAVTDPVMWQQAANLGAKIQSEDGIANAVSVIKLIEL